MNGLIDRMSGDEESIATSTTGMMTPTTSIRSNSTTREVQDSAPILLEVDCRTPDHSYNREWKQLQINMRRNMPFGQLVALLRTKFPRTENHRLRLVADHYALSEWRIIFDGDTPDSLKLSDCAKLKFVPLKGIEAIDMSIF
ncbi:hypothetical protein M436DRAFT_84697 [Aureobasidium namibiae CBS 147.97]|uniref:Uncharacterized protein n=1 Tax=Aureobasidium namibiae CBS 147.97 TaxID=1043004 RepID=A0A074WAJ6_9PEZI